MHGNTRSMRDVIITSNKVPVRHLKPAGPTKAHPSHLHSFIMKRIGHYGTQSPIAARKSKESNRKPAFVSMLETSGPFPTDCGKDECANAYVQQSRRRYEQLTGHPVRHPLPRRPPSAAAFRGRGYSVYDKGLPHPKPPFERMLLTRRPGTAPPLHGKEGVLAREKQHRKRSKPDNRIDVSVHGIRSAYKEDTGAPRHPPKFHTDHVGGSLYGNTVGLNVTVTRER